MENEGQEKPRYVVTRCFCLPLRTACIIIAAIELIAFISLITYNGEMVSRFTTMHHRFEHLIVFYDLIETIIHFGVAMLLVIGVWREKRQLVWAWVYTRLVVLATDLFTTLFASAITVNWPYIVFSIIIIQTYIIFIIIVRSYAHELRARDKLDPLGERIIPPEVM